jgi:hypothetical protein
VLAGLQPLAAWQIMMKPSAAPIPVRPDLHTGFPMNTIIYIVGLVVVIGFLLSFFGLR